MGLEFFYFTIYYIIYPLYYCYSPYSVNGKIVELRNGSALGGRLRSFDPAGNLALLLGCTRNMEQCHCFRSFLKSEILCFV